MPTITSAFTSAAIAAKTGSTIDFADPTNALASDNSRAVATLAAGEKSTYLVITNLATKPYGQGARITGVTLSVEGSQLAGGDVTELNIYPVVGGVVIDTLELGADNPLNEATDDVLTYTLSQANLNTLGIQAGDVSSSGFGIALSYEAAGLGSDARIDYVSASVSFVSAGEDNEVDVMAFIQSGGLMPLSVISIPACATSAQVFASAPEGTVCAQITVESQDLIIKWDGGTATTSAGGGTKYYAGASYWLPFSRNYLKGARAIQAGATVSGTITFFGKA